MHIERPNLTALAQAGSKHMGVRQTEPVLLAVVGDLCALFTVQAGKTSDKQCCSESK